MGRSCTVSLRALMMHGPPPARENPQRMASMRPPASAGALSVGKMVAVAFDVLPARLKRLQYAQKRRVRDFAPKEIASTHANPPHLRPIIAFLLWKCKY